MKLMSFASNKTQILELVDTPSRLKPSNFGHMISRGQGVHPISLKQAKMMVIYSYKLYRVHQSVAWYACEAPLGKERYVRLNGWKHGGVYVEYVSLMVFCYWIKVFITTGKNSIL